MKAILLTLLILIGLLLSPSLVSAEKANVNCENRYVTLINPVRGRDLWFDQSLKPINDQYEAVKSVNYHATWLLQYDTLLDNDLLGAFKNFDRSEEIGVFLEVSQKFADQSRVIYPYDAPWFSPRAVFLSGYSQSERRRLIDNLFGTFKSKFGYYPKSVGAWWIDSYSFNYIVEKYEIKSALIVADQLTTDSYGVWGQWWGVPFYPSKANILTPASNLENKQNVVVLQWAQRDPLLAHEEGFKSSNYSLQANDYIRQGKDTSYFNGLVNSYLDCRNPVGQVTVGLETGIESIQYLPEYKNQLKLLKGMAQLKPVTMSEFADQYSRIYPDFPKKISIEYMDSVWKMDLAGRSNDRLHDNVEYNNQIAFSDYFVPDRSNFLDRVLRNETINRQTDYYPIYLLVLLASLIFFGARRMYKEWIIISLFVFTSLGLILKSGYQYGWAIYYGPVLHYLMYAQAVLVLVSFIGFWYFFRKFPRISYYSLLIPLSFGVDFILQFLRLSFISGKYYFGFLFDSLRFVGIAFSKPLNIEFVNRDFPAYQAGGLLHFDYSKIWENWFLSILVYPAVHLLLAFILGYLLMKVNKKARFIILFVLSILFLLQVIYILQSDPRVVEMLN